MAEAAFWTNRRIEQFATLMLALSTICSAWCVYQSSKWGGLQSLSQGEANSARIDSSSMFNYEILTRVVDVQLGIQYVRADRNDDPNMVSFWGGRLRPEFKKAFLAWLAIDPLKNPNAPRGPFQMPEYVSPILNESERLSKLSTEKVTYARQANLNSDRYVLLTVLFASVLLFCGISTKFQAKDVRLVALGFGVIVCIIAFFFVFILPVA